MKKTILYLALLASAGSILYSCKKQVQPSNPAVTFIKSFVQNENIITVNSFSLSDGNYILLGKNPLHTNRGLMIKLDPIGTVLWQKSLSPLITILWKAIPLQGGGFVAAGFDSTQLDHELNSVIYDNNGNITSTNTFYPGIGCSLYPLDMIQLNNGNFAFSGCVWDINSYPIPFLMITDKSWNVVTTQTYNLPAASKRACVTALCESSYGILNITGFVQQKNIYVYNAFLLQIYPDGLLKSSTWLIDSVNYDSPNCIALSGNDSVIIANSQANINSGIGALVDYNENPNWTYVSGTINIDRFNSAGQFFSAVRYSGYPNNGLINSMKTTSDGGYILCGTVNQLSNTTYTTNTEIFVLKLDANLNKQWSSAYPTAYPSFGVDACQTNDGGYLISGYQQSFNNYYEMVLIKTDPNGNVN